MGKIQHKTEAAGAWSERSFLEQMSNIGSEIYRALNWKDRDNIEYSNQASLRALELFDLSKDSKHTHPQLRELCRMRELWLDYYLGDNSYSLDHDFFNNYFNQLTIRYKNSLRHS